MSISYFSDLYSHPGKYLEKHLIGCSRLVDKFIKESDTNLMAKNILPRVTSIISLCHDLGKSTSYFQTYLDAKANDKKKFKGMKETHHSLISAVICYFIVKNEVEKYNLEDDERMLIPFISYIVIKKHHGNLDDIMNEAAIEDEDIETMKKQLESIDMNRFKILNENLNSMGLNADLNKENVYTYITHIKEELRYLRRILRKIDKRKDISKYIYINYVFSLLIDSDKSEVVVGDNVERREINLPGDIVDNYKKELSYKENKMNILRENAYKEVNDKIDTGKKILSINLPTGLGKTFTTISYALKLREKILKESGIKYRIIYSLPFLSIIEQNAQEFEKILKANGINLDSDTLLKHHHLSDVKYRKDNTEFETDQAKIMIEGWNSEIIVTTFIQFFHTILSNRNKSLRKFHRIANSIIILDEIQSIPFHYWLLMKEILKAVTNELNSYVIFVTATQPLIFKEDEIYSLVEKQKYFKEMDRVKIYPVLKNDMTLTELSCKFDLDDGRSYLFILNTIKSAQQFYDMIKERVPNEEIIYMSTHVLPFERLKRIEKKIKDGKGRIAVTTQLVEAGVDIDFDVVVRDLAPLDSINQSAGRCNRNWENEGEVKGEVYVVSLIDENCKRYSSHIYDKVLLNITKDILSKYDFIEENEFLNIVEKYYCEVSNKMSSDKAIEMLNAIYKLKYDSDDGTAAITKFKLIEEGYYKVDAFIELNKEAIELWQKYIDLKEIKNLFERRNLFNKFKADFYKYTISIPATTENMPADVEGFKYVNNESLKEYYDKETGFITKGIVTMW
ncbi:MAG: CRISPR-associated helicase Cas3' [Thermoanaerobacteraceae bacterium]|nr:CRISPR-associated helicase Cas3' [Thermoanaerobacteraceae bacterium]